MDASTPPTRPWPNYPAAPTPARTSPPPSPLSCSSSGDNNNAWHEFLPLFDGLAGDHTAPAAWHAAHIVALAETGDPAAADLLTGAVARLGEIPDDWLWLATVTLLADACIRLGDRDAAAELYRRLSPHRDHTAIIAHGIASLGPVIARLAALRRLNPGAATSTWLHPSEAA